MYCNSFRILILFLFTFVSFAFNVFVSSIPVVVWYFGLINIFTFMLFGIDKLNSIKNRRRVPELSFHFFSFVGGAIGLLLGVLVFRHKLRDKYFLLIQFGILLLWLITLFLIVTNIGAIMSWGKSFSG